VDTKIDVRDKVHMALQHALDETGIECPFPTQTLNLQVRSEMGESISQTLRGQNQKPGGT